MKNREREKTITRIRRKKRVRAKLRGSARVPRLSVFRSHKHITSQIINDETGRTLIFANDNDLKKTSSKRKKTEVAFAVGELVAERAKAAKITKVAFDKGYYPYHGRGGALAGG